VPTFDNQTSHISEGNYDHVFNERVMYGDQTSSSTTKPTFVRMIILEVISDPATLDAVKISHFEHDLGVANIAHATIAPRNSVIARPVFHGNGAADNVMVLWPFFPPHMQFPAKPGEHIWVMFEDPNAPNKEIGYWLFRVTQPSFVEDVNYTHADRTHDPSFLPGLTSIFTGTDNPVYEFRNGAVGVDSTSNTRYSIAETASIPGGDDTAYEQLLTTTDASKIIQYEAVPRYRKRPADISLEGSNNTLIVLGTDRTSAVSDYTTDPDLGMVPKPMTADISSVGAGAIDIVVGRGQTPSTYGNEEKNQLVSGSPLNVEIGKSKKDLAANEGDPDFMADRSRIYVAQKTMVDTNFGLATYNANFSQGAAPAAGEQNPPKDNPKGDGAIVVKSDKVRLIARSDLEIVVTGILNRDSNGRIVESESASTWACIIIKANGDIVLKPATTGIIKLGGDNANLAPLCTILNNMGAGGTVTATSIADTMGGVEGGGGPAGQFPTKVLMM